MKKLWSIILATVMIAGTFPAMPTVFADNANSFSLDFEDGDASANYGTMSGGAERVTVKDKNGNDTKALSIKYDGLGKGGSPTTTSNWSMAGDSALVTGEEIAFGFDFMIDGTYTIAKTYQSRNNPGHPTLFSVVAGSETTPLVSAKYIGGRGESDWNAGPKQWEVMFTNGRLTWVGSGVIINPDTWVSVNLVLHLKTGTYDAYVNGTKVKEGLKIGHVTDNTQQVSGGSNLKSMKIAAGTTGHYNVDIYSTWQVYVDNISGAVYQPLSYLGGKVVDDKGNAVTNVLPVNNPMLSFNNEIKTFNLTMNGTAIAATDIVKGQGGEYTIKHTPFAWGTEYTIAGTATDIYGKTVNVSLEFTTVPAVDNMIEVMGFYNAESKELTALESGNITAKLRFWQTQQSTYTYMMVLYQKNADGKIEMKNIAADTVTSAEIFAEKSISLAVPEEFENCYVQIVVWDNLTNRSIYTADDFYGARTLK
ncbi:MAG: hypothetical protein E7409_07200 [Ruminococcaceae bacterium]|nr:hypothetical protein [Oscillospiraceae bacterium]